MTAVQVWRLLAPQEKPRIRLAYDKLGSRWICTSEKGVAGGQTPDHAYIQWAALLDWAAKC